jgi:hypothetical protein
MMLKQAIIALVAFGAIAMSVPAEAGHRDRGRTQIVVRVGTPVYYGHPNGGYYSRYRAPYYQPYYYNEQPRYRTRPRYYDDDYYYRPQRRQWQKRYRQGHYHRGHW